MVAVNILRLRFKQLGDYSFSLAFCLLLVAGCAENSSSSSKPEEVVDEKSGTPAKIRDFCPRDKSYDFLEYRIAGVPDEEVVWSGEEMVEAVRGLYSLNLTNTERLPRYESEMSGEVFSRLTASENLKMYQDQSLSLDQRLSDALKHLKSVNEIMELYVIAFEEQAVGDNEMIELFGAQLRVMTTTLDLLIEFLATIDKDDPTYDVRVQGMVRAKEGAYEMVETLLELLEDSQDYRPDVRKRLLGYMQDSLPLLIPLLTQEQQAHLQELMHACQKDPQLQELQPELGDLLKALEEPNEVIPSEKR